MPLAFAVGRRLVECGIAALFSKSFGGRLLCLAIGCLTREYIVKSAD